jgi:hypothetical protein
MPVSHHIRSELDSGLEICDDNLSTVTLLQMRQRSSSRQALFNTDLLTRRIHHLWDSGYAGTQEDRITISVLRSGSRLELRNA